MNWLPNRRILVTLLVTTLILFAGCTGPSDSATDTMGNGGAVEPTDDAGVDGTETPGIGEDTETDESPIDDGDETEGSPIGEDTETEEPPIGEDTETENSTTGDDTEDPMADGNETIAE